MWWKTKIFIMTGQDFYNDRSRFFYERQQLSGSLNSLAPTLGNKLNFILIFIPKLFIILILLFVPFQLQLGVALIFIWLLSFGINFLAFSANQVKLVPRNCSILQSGSFPSLSLLPIYLVLLYHVIQTNINPLKLQFFR